MTLSGASKEMKPLIKLAAPGALCACVCLGGLSAIAQDTATLQEGSTRAVMAIRQAGDSRSYELTSNAELRDNQPPEKRVTFSEAPNRAKIRTGNLLFDGLYALALHEAAQNSVPQVRDNAYGKGAPIALNAYQTGEFWTYVWTRDLAYSVHLALAGFDPQRAVNSLLFKTSVSKASAAGTHANQIIQDTGSGGSYPVSTDRIVWALGAHETLKYLGGTDRQNFLNKVYPILRDTIEQDRHLVFDTSDGLYRGEQSFLDWREQTYPPWTRNNVLPIAMSKTLSINAANCFLLQTASEYAGRLGHRADAARYASWAKDLKAAINHHFFDSDAGLYSTCLLTDGAPPVRVHRYDLLAESLAVLFGIADQAKAEMILENYPVGPYGPPVVWPQERSVPIYHNQAIWPFVTAYWIKAAQKAGHSQAVDHGVHSLLRGAAFNLSNMENLDFVTGLPEVKGRTLNGPVINSRRQLWSVAGYLSMVQDVVFGLETSWDGLRFRPFITTRLRNETFASSEVIELQDFAYRGTHNHVRVHLPPEGTERKGVCAIQRMELNGKKLCQEFVSAESLPSANVWDIYLQPPVAPHAAPVLRRVDASTERAIFGPSPPVWDETQQAAITLKDGHPLLHYRHPEPSTVVFNIYRDGQLCAKAITQTEWADTTLADCNDRAPSYAIEAVDPQTSNASHLTCTRRYHPEGRSQVLPAKAMQNRGGNLVASHHFENWGQRGHELLTRSFRVDRTGRYLLRAEFSNGAGPINTGITCAVKRLEVCKAGTNQVIAAGYLVMPQSGDWQRWDMSSPVGADLAADETYSLRICEDEYSRNMSYLQHNERYTALAGGGAAAYNFVNISAVHLDFVAAHPLRSSEQAASP